ncbi:neural-cadherin [Hyalella azteca]|uniref:Neural-cadherin n=1 Tax=Hyalella azteca TaxID=294128 RepID=A0A8B7NII1_HYAAZ|nr:neural-cadherin [Hyalella azteca]
MRRQMTLTLVPHSAESAHRDVSLVKIATVVSAHAAPPAPLGRLPRLPFPGDATQRHGTDTETDNVSSLFRDKFRFNFDEPDPVYGQSLGNFSRGLGQFSARITWQGANSGIRLDSDSGLLLLDPAAGLGRHEAKLLLSSASGEAHELTVYADVSSVGVADTLKSTPIDLAILPHDLLTNADAEEPNSESPLDRLLRLLNQHLADYSELSSTHSAKPYDMSAIQPHVMVVAVETIRLNHDSHTRVWLLQQPPERHLRFALEPLIFQHQHEIEAEVGAAVLGVGVSALGDCASRRVACRCCCRDRLALDQRWHLADAGARSHAGPSLRIESSCRCPVQDGAEEERGQLASLTSAHAVTAGPQPACSRGACRNGGKCLPHAASGPRCACPGHTVGPHCKLLTRHFRPYSPASVSEYSSVPSFMVLPSLPTCSQLHITIFVLTQHKTGNILSSQSRVDQNSRYFHFLLDDGRPKLTIKSSGPKPPKSLTLQKNIADNVWHRLDVFWINETVTVMLDHCLDTGSDPFASTSQTTSSLPLESTQCRGSLPLTYNEGPIGWGAPLQLGGRYEDPKSSHERKSLNSENDFHGCLSHVRVNKEFQDLGSPGAMTASVAGCGALSCFRPSNACPRHARCQGSPGKEQCECAPGRAGAGCLAESPALFFLSKSHVNVALSFTPPEYWAQIELRFRARTSDGTLVLLRSRHRTDWLSVELQAGSVCLVVGLDGRVYTSLCVAKKFDDGEWHHAITLRHAELLEVAIDEAEQDSYASALLPELQSLPFSVSRHDGAWLGGLTESAGVRPTSADKAFRSVDVAFRSADVAPRSVDVAPRSVDVTFRSAEAASSSKEMVELTQNSPDAARKLLISSPNFVESKTEASTYKQRESLSLTHHSNVRPLVSGRSDDPRLPGFEYFRFSRKKRSRSHRKRRNRVELDGGSLWKDFNNGCLSAVRVFGHLLPLPEIVDNNHGSNNKIKNTSNSAGSVTSFANVISGCTSPSVCTNTSCPPPLTCGHSWGLNTCGCAAGEELSRDGTACLDVDECRYDPCLNLGVCVNTHPGYRCVCGPAHRGEHCEWGAAGALEAPYSLSILVASAATSAAALLLIIVSCLLCLVLKKKRRRKSARCCSESDARDRRANANKRRPLPASTKDGLAPLSELAELSPGSCSLIPSNSSCHLGTKGESCSVEQTAQKETSVSVIGSCPPRISVVGMDLVNLPIPTGGTTDMGDPDILLPPPPLQFNPSSTTFGFDGGGLNSRAGSIH